MSEYAIGYAYQSLRAMLLPFLQRWYRKDGKRCSVQRRLSFELCTRLSLKEFGSLLNFLPNPSHATETHWRTRLLRSYRYLTPPGELSLSYTFHILLLVKLLWRLL